MWLSVTADEWQPLYNDFLNATNCTNTADSLACLRSVDAKTLSGVFSSDLTTLNRPNPVVDGDFLDMVMYDGFIKATAQTIARLYPDDPAQGIPSTLNGRPSSDTGLGLQWKRSSAYNGVKVMQAGRRLASEAVSLFLNTTLVQKANPINSTMISRLNPGTGVT
jgi:triacylglycerol lipase